VSLNVENNVLTLLVTDDGCGFNLQELTESEGLGVAGMRERAALINGSLEVYSQPEKGTRVYFNVPLDGKSQTDV
jgi:signal transduction histidine kinase